MREQSEARGTAAAPLVEVPVDLVDFEARLIALERHVREHEARDQLLLRMAEGLRRLTDEVAPLLQVVKAPIGSGGAVPEAPPAASSYTASLAPASAPPPPPASAPSTIIPERLAAAQARIREEATRAPEPPLAPLSPPPPGRRPWLLRVLRRTAAGDPDAAGRLLVALLPAYRVAGIEPVSQLPGPPATVARVVVRGRFRRRLGWEMAQLACELATVSALAKLVRVRVSPAQLHTAGVRPDQPLALALVAHAIDPRWTVGLRFTLAHLDADAAYLQVRDGARPLVTTERPAGAVATTVRCSADALLPLFAGEPGVAASVEGERRPFQLLQGWFADATGA